MSTDKTIGPASHDDLAIFSGQIARAENPGGLIVHAVTWPKGGKPFLGKVEIFSCLRDAPAQAHVSEFAFQFSSGDLMREPAKVPPTSNQMSRRTALRSACGLTAVSVAGLGLVTPARAQIFSAQTRLAIPPMFDSRELGHDLSIPILRTRHEFFRGKPSVCRGFGQSYLGPTIRLYDGEATRVRYTNMLDEPTSVHGHGLHVPGHVDGGPQSAIPAGETWDVTLPIKQQASTNWYHPHLMGSTSEQVHSGLAGLYLVEDQNSASLPLPKTYGVDDLPLIIQDRDFDRGIMVPYAATDREMMTGKREPTIIVNGTVRPYFEAAKGWVRLRLLNASNARAYEFHLGNDEPFFKIATEGGFLEKPVALTSLRMVPGERNEIMIDLSDGKDRQLYADLVPTDDDFLEELFRRTARVLQLRVRADRTGTGTLPSTLNTIERLKTQDASVTRDFRLQMRRNHNHSNDHHSMFAINGLAMDPAVINERVRKGTVEIWRVTRDKMDHPFHVHGTSFQILSRNNRLPRLEDQGWKDTVEVGY